MQDLLHNIIPEFHKSTILGSVKGHLTVLQFAIAKLYLSKFSSEFMDIGMEGILVLILNRKNNSLELQHYDYKNCKLQLEMTLYINLTNKRGYLVLQECFHAIQTDFGFMGINYLSKFMAQKMKKTLMNCSKVLMFIHQKSKKCPVNCISPSISESIPSSSKKINDFRKRLDSLSVVKKKSQDIQLANYGFINGDINFSVNEINNVEFSCRIGNAGVLEMFFKKIKAQGIKEIKEGNMIHKNMMNFSFINFDEEKRLTLLRNKGNKDFFGDISFKHRQESITQKKVYDTCDLKEKKNSLKHLSHLNFRRKHLQKGLNENLTEEDKTKRGSVVHVKFNDEITVHGSNNKRYKGSVMFADSIKSNQLADKPKEIKEEQLSLKILQQMPETSSNNPMVAQIKQVAFNLKPSIKKSLKVKPRDTIHEDGMKLVLQQLNNQKVNTTDIDQTSDDNDKSV